MKKILTSLNILFRKVSLPACILCAVSLCCLESDAVNGTGERKDRVEASSSVTKNSDGSIVVNTTELGKGIRGFKGATPLEITVKKGKIISVKALPNHETPAYFRKLIDRGFLDSWNGMTIKKAAESDVDGVTGATYSSKAVKANVKAAANHLLGK